MLQKKVVIVICEQVNELRLVFVLWSMEHILNKYANLTQTQNIRMISLLKGYSKNKMYVIYLFFKHNTIIMNKKTIIDFYFQD